MINWWEEMVIQFVLGIVRGLIKNPTKASLLRATLLHVADEIYAVYGEPPVSKL